MQSDTHIKLVIRHVLHPAEHKERRKVRRLHDGIVILNVLCSQEEISTSALSSAFYIAADRKAR